MNFDEQIIRKGSKSVKWDQAESLFLTTDALPMWVADMDFKAPQVVLDALKERLDHGVFGYAFQDQETQQAVADWLKRRHGWTIQTDAVTFTPGIVTALSFAVQAFTAPNDEVVIQSPVYTPFYQMIERNGRIVSTNPLKIENNRYMMDFDDLEKKLSRPEAKLMFLCHPHNPSGRAWSKEELKRVGDLCIQYGVTVVSDEIHSDLMLYGQPHVPFASLSDEIANITVTCIAPSKTFNLAGLQASAIIIYDEEKRTLFTNELQRNGLSKLNAFAIPAMEAAYRHGDEWLDSLVLYLENNMKIAMDYIDEYLPSMRYMKPDASYLLWLDIRDYELTQAELKRNLLKKGKVILELGNVYGHEGDGFIRMNLGCPAGTVKEGLKRLHQAFTLSSE
ncbi:MalY/PatB family protein [Bacillus altitudinis]|uniref:MalY/PatB family protein n=1 Tax=Bacillus altitudinis TaxID=293387 RepID=UPI00041B3277|nr:MalY/PatB family protein [Bacillus altitudinis]MDR4197583.1 pyridoxal phosphate-dependent aminotransferase [Bacillus altitudinis]